MAKKKSAPATPAAATPSTPPSDAKPEASGGLSTVTLVCMFVGLLLLFALLSVMPSNAYEFMAKIERTFTTHSSGRAFFTHEQAEATEWAAHMRRNYKTIYQELEEYKVELPDATFILPGVNPELKGPLWRTGWVKMYGSDTAMAAHFPKTMEILKQTPIITAQFSVMDPTKVLDWHRGPYKGVLRYLLHLHVPQDPTSTCVNSLKVNNGTDGADDIHTTIYVEGEDTIFDDALMHVASNECNFTRVSLFCDFPRPDMPLWVRLLNQFSLKIMTYSDTLDEKLRQIRRFQEVGRDMFKGSFKVEDLNSTRNVLTSDQGHSMLDRHDTRSTAQEL